MIRTTLLTRGMIVMLVSGCLALSGSAQTGPRPEPGRARRRPGLLPRAAHTERTERQPAALPCNEITFVLGESCGRVKPLTDVNVGPMPAGTPGNADLTEAYHRLGIRSVRTHDYYGPLDMSTMYPDLDADPDDPASYDFASSDGVIRALIEKGFEPYLRIGDSWNNVRLPGTATRRDHFVRAAVQVVRHYVEGQWDGFRAPIRCVEIWNEPDLQQFWPASYETFLRCASTCSGS